MDAFVYRSGLINVFGCAVKIMNGVSDCLLKRIKNLPLFPFKEQKANKRNILNGVADH